MNILFICKRYYTGKDVIRHRFGRLYEIPRQLASLGHQVTVLCFDYRNDDPCEIVMQQGDGGSLKWIVISLRDVFSPKAWLLFRELKGFQPSIVIGSSDIPCLWFSRQIALRFRLPYIVDLYDNYESFGQARIPGFCHALKKSIRDASGVFAVSAPLKEKIVKDYCPRAPVTVLHNGVSGSVFCAGDAVAARQALGLPLTGRLIGTAGNLSAMKGLDTVYEAWSALESAADDLYLVLAGKVSSQLPVPRSPRVIYLGELSEKQVSQLFRALDLGVIPAHDSEFGRYCFPQKLFEMLGCGLPVVAARVGAIAQILQAFPDRLFIPGDADSLRMAVFSQLEDPVCVPIESEEWSSLVKAVEPLLLSAISKRSVT